MLETERGHYDGRFFNISERILTVVYYVVVAENNFRILLSSEAK
jgi:hypothetical protein